MQQNSNKELMSFHLTKNTRARRYQGLSIYNKGLEYQLTKDVACR